MIKQCIKKVVYYSYLFLTKKVDFRHYWILSRPYHVPQFHDNPGQQGNYCYGNWQAVKNARGGGFDPHCMIEHGIYFGRVVLEDECVYPSISTIYTYSPYRQEVLKEYFGEGFNKRIVPVGPYITYADHHLSKKKRQRIKKQWGRVLLVFPSHSSSEGETSFDYDTWLSQIDKRASNYDTVIVSLFWLDVYNGNHKKYQEKGYLLACCGNRFDPRFLSRQKDMISLADMTMSNDIGTHVGYCIAMGKPHYIYHQEVKYEAKNDKDKDTDTVSANRHIEYKELFSLFSEFKEEITPDQVKAVKYYWGQY